MSEEDYDAELPLISINPSTRESEEFSMPPADVLASQRAREEECEEELRQLRAQYAQTARVAGDSSSSDSEGSLAAAVDALDVAPPDPAPAAVDLVAALAAHLAGYNIHFLTLYLDILRTNNEHLIRTATNDISSSIESAVAEALQTGQVRSEEEVVVVVSWLCTAVVWAGPRVPAARRLLHAMLAMATPQSVKAAGEAVAAAVRDARALVRAADAARGAGPAGALAAALRAAALRRLAPSPSRFAEPLISGSAGSCEAGSEEPDVEAVCARLSGAWHGLCAADRLAALQLVGRARWPTQEGADGAALRAWLARVAQPPPAHHRHSPDYLKILVGASKLQILFKVNP